MKWNQMEWKERRTFTVFSTCYLFRKFITYDVFRCLFSSFFMLIPNFFQFCISFCISYVCYSSLITVVVLVAGVIVVVLVLNVNIHRLTQFFLSSISVFSIEVTYTEYRTVFFLSSSCFFFVDKEQYVPVLFFVLSSFRFCLIRKMKKI